MYKPPKTYIKFPGYLEIHQNRQPQKNQTSPLEVRRKILTEQQNKLKNSMYVTRKSNHHPNHVTQELTSLTLQDSIVTSVVEKQNSFFTASPECGLSACQIDGIITPPRVSIFAYSTPRVSNFATPRVSNFTGLIAKLDDPVDQRRYTVVEIAQKTQSVQNPMGGDSTHLSSDKKQHSFCAYVRAPAIEQYVNLDNINERRKITSLIRSISPLQNLNRSSVSRINLTHYDKSQVSMVLQQSILTESNFNKYSLNRSNGLIQTGKKKIFS